MARVNSMVLALCVTFVTPFADAIDIRVERVGNTPASNPASDVQFINESVSWLRTVAVGGAGQLWRTDDGGMTWQEFSSPVRESADSSWPSPGLVQFSFDGHKGGWARTFEGVFLTLDSGRAWNR